MSPILGVSEENLIEEGNTRKHIPGEKNASKSKIDEATTESEPVGTGVVKMSYNRLDPTVLRDGIDFVRALKRSKDEYVVEYKGYITIHFVESSPFRAGRMSKVI